MRVLQALRRSIKGEKDAKPHVSIAPKSALAIVPPKKVRHRNQPPPPKSQLGFPVSCCASCFALLSAYDG